MDSFSIGLSGLDAAQKGLDVIGNNIANAATEGYHRQRIEFSPAYATQIGELVLGGGVEVDGITRLINTFVEQQILQQQTAGGQIESQLNALTTIENTFGELSSSGGLNGALEQFFAALQDLSAHPNEGVWQNQLVTAAKSMAEQFNNLAAFLDDVEDNIILEMHTTIDRINALGEQIAELNEQIRRKEVLGGQANNLRDQRDQAINELAELAPVETRVREFGVVDVSIAGTTGVAGATFTALKAGLTEDRLLGVAPEGQNTYYTDIQGGRIGGLVGLKNDTLAAIRGELDALAGAIITRVNQYHVQGVGSQGSFTQLSGWAMSSENLADFDEPVSDGTIYIRVTDTTTGTVTRYGISVDASTDTLSTIAAAITSGVVGVSASVNASRLTITADAGYTFDFLPAVLDEPTASTLNGSSPPSIAVSGIYTGRSNDTFRFTVSGAGSVGNGSLQLEVRDNGGSGEVVATLNIGQGYAAGDLLDVGNGIKIAVGPGDFAAGDNFDVEAFADTDTSGVLAAAGINTFFAGSSAADISLDTRIAQSPGAIATALGRDMTDNANALRMAGLRDQTVAELDSLTPSEFYHRLITSIGQQVSLLQMQQDHTEAVMRDLSDQQSRLSGVDINEQAAQMLLFEQMFAAMAKYLSTVSSSLSTLMDLL